MVGQNDRGDKFKLKYPFQDSVTYNEVVVNSMSWFIWFLFSKINENWLSYSYIPVFVLSSDGQFIETIIISANKHKWMEFTMTLGNVKLNHTKTISIKRWIDLHFAEKTCFIMHEILFLIYVAPPICFIILSTMTNNEIRVRKCKDNLHSFSLYKCLALSVRHNFEKLRWWLFFLHILRRWYK